MNFRQGEVDKTYLLPNIDAAMNTSTINPGCPIKNETEELGLVS
jgi:hypothetical protein